VTAKYKTYSGTLQSCNILTRQECWVEERLPKS